MNAETIEGGNRSDSILHEPIATESTAQLEDVQLDTVYYELRKIAVGRLRRISPWDSLSPTLLVNEAYMKLIRACVGSCSFSDRRETRKIGNRSTSGSPTPRSAICEV